MIAKAALSAIEREYVRREHALFSYTLLNDAAASRDILALAASKGRYRAAELIRRVKEKARVVGELDPEWARNFATLLADQPKGPEDTEDAISLLRAMAEHLGPQAIRKTGRFRLVELLVEQGKVDDLPQLLSGLTIGRENIAQPHLFAANASNPFRGDDLADAKRTARWARSMNGLFAVDGLEGIDIAPGDEAPFDRILSGAGSIVTDGPLVTVIIPTYAPGARLATAVESLLAQSYRNLQILIMDDASPEAAAEELDRWTERDPRIQVVHLVENNGPYLARNAGAARHAAGDYVTIHDDDDWSHPRKIELQVAHLETERQYVANMSNAVRASDDLWFGRVNGNPVWTQQALNTLMVRRSVFDEIGYWDVLNRSADAEFNDRIRAWTGDRIPVVGRVPLSFYRVRWDSLSAGEFNKGYMDPRRRWYYQSYLRWHVHEKEESRAPHLPMDSRDVRSFSAPSALLGSRAASARRSLFVDVILAADFRAPGDEMEALCGLVEDALAQGVRVSLMQLDSPVLEIGSRIHPRLLEAALHPNATVISVLDEVTSALVVVADPTTLQFMPDQRSGVSTDRLVLIGRAPHQAQYGGELYDLSTVIANGEAIFGRRAEVREGIRSLAETI